MVPNKFWGETLMSKQYKNWEAPLPGLIWGPASFTLTIRGKHISAITALSTRGIEDVCLAEGSVDGNLFVHFVEHSLLSLLQPFNGSNARVKCGHSILHSYCLL